MSRAQRGMYWTLICEAWAAHELATLPDDDDELWVLSGCKTKEEWVEEGEPVKKCFTSVVREGRKVLIQDALEECKRKALEKSEQTREAGIKSGAARRAQREINDSSTSAERPLQPAYQGKALTVTKETDDIIAHAYPHIDRQAEYRRAEAWMLSHPGMRKGTPSFITSWFSRTETMRESRSIPSQFNGNGSTNGKFTNYSQLRSQSNAEAFSRAIEKAESRDIKKTPGPSGGRGGDPF